MIRRGFRNDFGKFEDKSMQIGQSGLALAILISSTLFS